MPIQATPGFILPEDPRDDPVRGSDGYPHEIELQRIRTWPHGPGSTLDGLHDLMEYVRQRWSYPDRWDERDVTEYGRRVREYHLSTGGWSGNEDLIHALEKHEIFSLVAPWSWRRGGHYVYHLPAREGE